MPGTEIRPFTIDISQTELDDLQARLAMTRFAQSFDDTDSTYGVSVQRVRQLVEYWRDGYDWRAWESRLNGYPQFSTEIFGQNVHFLHIVGEGVGEREALPLILTHGWPGSVLEYLNLIEPLTAAGFSLVIPSIPGYGFSGPTSEPGWNAGRVAQAWAELMHRLGYRKYGVVGNDAGAIISPEVGRVDPDHVVGVHVNQVFAFPSGDPAELLDLTEDEQQALQTLTWFFENKSAFNLLHGQQPQTLAHAIEDSPAGLLGWNSQLLDESLEDDFVITNIAIYWFTRTAGSALRLYFENERWGKERMASGTVASTTVPLGLAGSAGDFYGIRRFADRDHTKITSWNVHPVKTHYLAHAAPELLAADIQQFYAELR
jgi:pimeloyl-ACP methyl ester carboxylesterase